MKPQVIVIGGGDTFDTYEEYLEFLKGYEIELSDLSRKKWKDKMQSELGEGYQVIIPRMPNNFNCRYVEWKIWFDKYVPFMNDGVVLVGSSMGGIFLAKYLSENKLPVSVKGTFLVAAPFDGKDAKYSLTDFILPESLTLFEKQGGIIHFYQSKDDPEVPFVDLAKYTKQLPNAETTVFEDRGHFWAEEFPELIVDIKKLS